MALEEGLYAYLVADAGVAALIGTRLYPLLVPQDAALPAMAYQRISGPRDHTHDGASGLAMARIQFTAVGSSYSEAKSVMAALRAALDGFSGTMGEVTVGAALLQNERDEWAESFDLPVVRQDYMVWYQEE